MKFIHWHTEFKKTINILEQTFTQTIYQSTYQTFKNE